MVLFRICPRLYYIYYITFQTCSLFLTMWSITPSMPTSRYRMSASEGKTRSEHEARANNEVSITTAWAMARFTSDILLLVQFHWCVLGNTVYWLFGFESKQTGNICDFCWQSCRCFDRLLTGQCLRVWTGWRMVQYWYLLNFYAKLCNLMYAKQRKYPTLCRLKENYVSIPVHNQL